MLAHWSGVAEIVELLNQAVEKSFFRRSADLTKFDGHQRFDLIGDRLLADLDRSLGGSLTQQVVVLLNSGREGNALFSLKDEQKRPADHILQLAIHLPPVPGLTNKAGDSRAPLGRVVCDDLLNEGNVVLGNGTIPIRQDCDHAVLFNRNRMRTHGFFQEKETGERLRLS